MIWSYRVAEVSPYVRITGKWDDYWMSLSKSFRSNVNNRMRRLERDCGPYRFDEASSAAEVQNALRRLIDLHRQRRENVDGSGGLFENVKTRAFYLDLVDGLFHAGWLRMPSLLVNDVAVAVQLNFEYAGTYCKKIPAFDMAYAKYGLGDLLNVHVLQQCFAKPVTCLDFLRGDESYKFKYNPSLQELLSITVFAPTAKGMLAQKWFGKIRPWLKSNGAIRQVAARGRSLVRGY